MQDTRTGRMVPVPEEVHNHAKDHQLFSTIPVFQVGETLILRSGRFEVEAIDENGIRLRGLPIGPLAAKRLARRNRLVACPHCGKLPDVEGGA